MEWLRNMKGHNRRLTGGGTKWERELKELCDPKLNSAESSTSPEETAALGTKGSNVQFRCHVYFHSQNSSEERRA